MKLCNKYPVDEDLLQISSNKWFKDGKMWKIDDSYVANNEII